MINLRTSDYVVASVPVGAKAVAELFATLTLEDLNNLAGIFGALLGAAFLIWRWRREAKGGSGKQE